ncbi:AAA family ATPase, partial [Actinomyces naeslundii]|uniref:AAA family ATPase n=1 Tax=Actinomyces naeslundii TaxID=1655 RepID=UPI002092EC3D
PTGSGKTTIIDAIVFALYGDVADSADSSKERIRSTLVGPHTESVIELVFSTGAGVYRVRRTPTYERAKRRGQGTTTQNGTVKLWHLAEVGGEPLDEPVTRVGDADAEIARAVGLSREQFTQTVVLPQGKFARFLRADTSERQHLLKDVFGTGIYDAIQDALIQASRDGARRVEQAAADLRGQVASLGRHPLLTEAPSPTETADAGEEIEDASHGAVRDDPSQEAPSGGTQEALPLPMDDTDREEPKEADAGPAPTPAQVLEAAMAGAAPDLVALRRVGVEVLVASRNRVALADARAEAAGTVLTRAQAARDEAQSLHDLLERRRALVEENQRLAERAEQDTADTQRLRNAERASRVWPYLVAEQAARRRAQQAVTALAARADQSGLAQLAEQAGVTSAGSDARSHDAEVTPTALVEPLVREAQHQLAALEDEPSEARTSAVEAVAPQDSEAAETSMADDASETAHTEALSPRNSTTWRTSTVASTGSSRPSSTWRPASLHARAPRSSVRRTCSAPPASWNSGRRSSPSAPRSAPPWWRSWRRRGRPASAWTDFRIAAPEPRNATGPHSPSSSSAPSSFSRTMPALRRRRSRGRRPNGFAPPAWPGSPGPPGRWPASSPKAIPAPCAARPRTPPPPPQTPMAPHASMSRWPRSARNRPTRHSAEPSGSGTPVPPDLRRPSAPVTAWMPPPPRPRWRRRPPL